MTNTQKLVDEILELQAKVAGKKLELAMALGNREEAVQHRKEMEEFIQARCDLGIAEQVQAGSCYFVAAGDMHRAAMQGRAHS